ncbi:MAG: hypothetical protein H6814_08680 [Phycisphaeraceae bacterium]|nr:hypothetical protein [Phycisphaeraceae bacterium]
MDDAIANLIENDPALLIPIVMFLVLGAVAIIGIFFGTITRSATAKELEKSRREIAAYIAEGSMTPEDGERLLLAGQQTRGKRRRCGS